MAKSFRKKPLTIQAVQFNGDNFQEVAEFLGPEGKQTPYNPRTSQMFIRTLEGEMAASAGDWIIRGVKGEFYPIKPDIFAATYEEVH